MRFVPFICFALLTAVSPIAFAADLLIDAREPAPAPAPLPLAVGARSPAGHVLAATTRYLTLDGAPWFPVLGEFHYSRYPAEEWQRELRKMRAGGVTVVSTYVFWIHHEAQEGHFDWSGRRDLRRFVDLCAQEGLMVWLRVGPWAHGEVRNGGFPDWLVQSGIPLRQNDPRYLSHVRRFFGEIAHQVQGRFWADGGRIVGVQLENEYHPASQGVDHMETLRQIARDAGMNPAYFSATGWDNAVVPRDGFLPVFGGYTEQFWSGLRTKLPPNQNFFFTKIRAEDNVMGDLSPRNSAYNAEYADRPFLTAEMGAGMATAYHRRPVMHAADSAAAAVVKLGSGANALGFYMYHGGTNPVTPRNLQETQRGWNGYNDMEAMSYDFQAPLGEFGQTNETYAALRTLNLFLLRFGSALAPMTPVFPAVMPASVNDTATPRAAARTFGDRGFVFINNHERNYALGPKAGFRVLLRLPHGDVTVPRRPTTLPEGAYPIWPVNLALPSGTLRYATAQLLTTVPREHTYLFFAWPGIEPELAFRLPDGVRLEAPHARITRDQGTTYVDHIVPGTSIAVRLSGPVGSPPVRIVVLSREQALHLAAGDFGGRARLVLTSADVGFDGSRLELSTRSAGRLTIDLFPAVDGLRPPFRPADADGVFQRFACTVPASAAEAVTATLVREAAPSRPVPLGPPPRAVAEEPDDADFDRAAQWTLRIDPRLATAPGRWFLDLDYVGDVARIYAGGRLVDDNFYKGTPWELGLWRFRPEDLARGLDLRVLPLRHDAPIFLEPSARPAFHGASDVVRLEGARLVHETDLVAELEPARGAESASETPPAASPSPADHRANPQPQ